MSNENDTRDTSWNEEKCWHYPTDDFHPEYGDWLPAATYATNPEYNDLAPAICVVNNRIAVLLHSTIRADVIYSKVGIIDGQRVTWKNSHDLSGNGTAQDIIALNENTVLATFCIYGDYNWKTCGRIGRIKGDDLCWEEESFVIRDGAYMPKLTKLNKDTFMLFFVDIPDIYQFPANVDAPYVHPDWVWKYVKDGCSIGYLFLKLSEYGNDILTSSEKFFKGPESGTKITGYSGLDSRHVVRYEQDANGTPLYRIGEILSGGELVFSKDPQKIMGPEGSLKTKYLTGTGLQNNRVFTAMVYQQQGRITPPPRTMTQLDGIFRVADDFSNGSLLTLKSVSAGFKDTTEIVALSAYRDIVVVARQINTSLETVSATGPGSFRRHNIGKLSHHIQTYIYHRKLNENDFTEQEKAELAELEKEYDKLPNFIKIDETPTERFFLEKRGDYGISWFTTVEKGKGRSSSFPLLEPSARELEEIGEVIDENPELIDIS